MAINRISSHSDLTFKFLLMWIVYVFTRTLQQAEMVCANCAHAQNARSFRLTQQRAASPLAPLLYAQPRLASPLHHAVPG